MLNKEQYDFLLKPKALPTNVHYINWRNALGSTKWNKVRQKIYSNAFYKCELCSAQGKIEAHELWNFNFIDKNQILENIVALCSKCHRIQHANLLKLQADKGLIDASKIVEHYNKLTNNNLTYFQFFALANKECQKLENIEWNILISKNLENLIE